MAKDNKSVIIYKSCETLPVFNFIKVINTDNLNWLIKGYEDFSSEEENYVFEDNLHSIWNGIIEEYLDLKKDKKVLHSYTARVVINRLEDVLKTCGKLLELCTLDLGLENVEKISNALSLHNKKYRLDLEKPLEQEKKRVRKLFLKLQFSIDIKKSNFEKEFKVNEENVKLDIYEEMANLEQSLPKSYEINPKTTVVAKWIALRNIAKKHNG